MNKDLLNFIDISNAYEAQMIPGKNTFTFISNQTGIPQAWILDDEHKPKLFGNYDDRVLGIHHAPQGNMTVVGVDSKGNERQQFYLHKEGNPEPEVLINSQEHFHKFGGWSPNGKQICFSSNRRQPGYFDVFVQDVDTKEIEKIFEFNGICEPVCWLPNGHEVLISIDETNIENTLYVIDLVSKEAKQIGDEQVTATYEKPQFEQDGSGSYILTNQNENTMFLGWFNPDSPEQIENIFHVEDWDIEEMQLSPNEQTLALTVNEGGYSTLAIYKPLSKNVHYVDGVPNGVISSLGWTNNHELIFTLKTPSIPGDIWKYDLIKSEIKRLTFISESKAIEHTLREPLLCHFKSFDGRIIPYFLYDKGDKPNKPAVIYIHGGPENQNRPIYNPVIQYLQSKGFAVVAPNVRGSKGYGKNYIKLDDVRKRMDAVKDLVWLTKDLQASHEVNDKIGLIGRSYGGFMVLAAMTHFPDIWSAGVDIVGISHFTTFLQNTGSWRRRLRESEYGSLEHDKDFFEKIAPLNRTKDIQAPLLVFHGKNDTRVPISEAKQLVSEMRERKQEVEFTVFEDEGHQTEKLRNIITMDSESIRFFEKHLMKASDNNGHQ